MLQQTSVCHVLLLTHSSTMLRTSFLSPSHVVCVTSWFWKPLIKYHYVWMQKPGQPEVLRQQPWLLRLMSWQIRIWLKASKPRNIQLHFTHKGKREATITAIVNKQTLGLISICGLCLQKQSWACDGGNRAGLRCSGWAFKSRLPPLFLWPSQQLFVLVGNKKTAPVNSQHQAVKDSKCCGARSGSPVWYRRRKGSHRPLLCHFPKLKHEWLDHPTPCTHALNASMHCLGMRWQPLQMLRVDRSTQYAGEESLFAVLFYV